VRQEKAKRKRELHYETFKSAEGSEFIEPRSISGTSIDETAAQIYARRATFYRASERTRSEHGTNKSHAIPFHHMHATARESITYNEARASDLFGGKPQIFYACPTSLRKRMRVERQRALLRSKSDVAASLSRIRTRVSVEILAEAILTPS